MTLPDELDQLIETANNGVEAIQRLYVRHANECSSVQTTGNLLPLSKDITPSLYVIDTTVISPGYYFKRTPKPAFEPFNIASANNGHYRVSLSEDQKEIKIGCKSFDLESLIKGLRRLTINGDIHYRLIPSSENLHATKFGIKHEGDLIPWAECEKLYDKIKDLK